MIKTIPEWALTPDDETQIAALLKRCFTTDFGGRSYFRQRHHLRLISQHQGKIIGHMALLFRTVKLAQTPVYIAGLAEVATDPDHRGKGVAQGLLKAAINQARSSGCAFFLLFGTARLYAANGFVQHLNEMTYLDLTDLHTGAVKTEVAEQLMVLALRADRWQATASLDLLGPLF